jgi:lauroyl/myristoyl acyltransferase
VDFQALSNSRLGIGLALAVSRAMPSALGYRLARAGAGRLVANPDAPMVRAIRTNQWMASGRTLHGEALDEAVRETLEMSGGFLYDIYHLPKDPKALLRKLAVTDVLEWFLAEMPKGPHVVVGVHLGNFDLVGQALGASGWRAQVLSVADPNGGYRWQNEMRARNGLEMTPVTIESLKSAARRLSDGGTVLTGIDRPLPGAELRPRFFGAPASVPVLHVRLAMRASAPVVVISALKREDGLYELQASEPLVMTGSVKNPDDVLGNAERALKVAEELIKRAPRQWGMPHAVWPDLQAP